VRKDVTWFNNSVITLALPKKAAILLVLTVPLSDMNSLKVRAAKILTDRMNPILPTTFNGMLIPLRSRLHWSALGRYDRGEQGCSIALGAGGAINLGRIGNAVT
jgi:hypothetical protein